MTWRDRRLLGAPGRGAPDGPVTGTGPSLGQRLASARALAVLAVSLVFSAHILWAQWRPLATSLVLGLVATTFLWWAVTTRGTPRIASGVVTAASSAGVITALTGVAGEWQELLILGAGAVVSASLALLSRRKS